MAKWEQDPAWVDGFFRGANYQKRVNLQSEMELIKKVLRASENYVGGIKKFSCEMEIILEDLQARLKIEELGSEAPTTESEE